MNVCRLLGLVVVLVLGVVLGGATQAAGPNPEVQGGALASLASPEPQTRWPVAASPQANVNTAFTYQGQLKASGTPATATCDFEFSLWDAAGAGTPPVGGAQVGATQTKSSVSVVRGVFTVSLDFGGVFTGAATWLGISVRCPAGGGTYTALGPRQELTVSPYALSLRPGAEIVGSTSVILTAINMGTGPGVRGETTSTAADAAGVVGEVSSTSANIRSAGVRGINNSTSFRGFGVYGSQAGTGSGVYGTSDGHGVYGMSTLGNGVYGRSTQGTGVRADAFAGRGVWGENLAAIRSGGGDQPGVYGKGDAEDGVWAISTTRDGLHAEGGQYGAYVKSTDATNGVGLYAEGAFRGAEVHSGGTAVYAVGGNYGVRGFSSESDGAGVLGQHSGTRTGSGVVGRSSNGDGVHGTSTGAVDASTAGVFGEATSYDGTGVLGQANNGPLAYGVFGRSTEGFAGYFSGKVEVTGNLRVGGTLTKGGGAFKIDHPLDPANKYLYHSFVESPDMKNVYDGVAVLDKNGEAVVRMPDWFEALNRDFRYQLTAIGAPGPNLHIAAKIKDNGFKIAGGTAGMEVSWQVTGIRQDAFANAHRIPVEESKPADEQGFYLHPDAFGKPASSSIEAARQAHK